MVTGRASYTTLERIGRLEDLAADESQPEAVRARAAQEIERIKTGGSVYPSHLRVNAELSLAELDQLAADPAQPANTTLQQGVQQACATVSGSPVRADTSRATPSTDRQSAPWTSAPSHWSEPLTRPSPQAGGATQPAVSKAQPAVQPRSPE